jgi:hypothetical protein
VLDVNSVDASEVFWNVSEVPSVDLVVTAHDERSAMKPATAMSLIGTDVFLSMVSLLHNTVYHPNYCVGE